MALGAMAAAPSDRRGWWPTRACAAVMLLRQCPPSDWRGYLPAVTRVVRVVLIVQVCAGVLPMWRVVMQVRTAVLVSRMGVSR